MEDNSQRTQPKTMRACILTSTSDNKAYPFRSFVDADKFLKKRHGYTRGRFGSGKLATLEHDDGRIELFSIAADESRRATIVVKSYQEQLCWHCGNCYGGCSWSRSFMPVDGWEATPVKRDNVETYEITNCPDFNPDTKNYIYRGERKNEN